MKNQTQSQLMEKLHSERTIYTLLFIFLFIDIGICLALSWNEMRIKKIDLSTVPAINYEKGALLTIDNAYFINNEFGNSELFINGWAVIKGKETKNTAIKVALKKEATGEVLLLPTSINTRKDVTSYMNDGVNYDNSGFSVHLKFSENAFDFTNNNYRVLVLYLLGNDQYILNSGSYTYIDKTSRR